MILTDRDIKKYLESEDLVLDPLENPFEQIQPCAYIFISRMRIYQISFYKLTSPVELPYHKKKIVVNIKIKKDLQQIN